MFPKITLLEPLTRPSGCLTRPSVLVFPEVELPLKKDGFTSESTTLEALLRGEGVEKKVDAREEESIQEIQVPCLGHGSPLNQHPHLVPRCLPGQGCICVPRFLDTTTRKLTASFELKASLHPRG